MARSDLGRILSEPLIARQMEVSRIPLREALAHLSKEGIVTRIQNRGFFVISFTPDDISEVFSLRSLLESMSLTESIPLLEPQDFKQLECLIEQQAKAIEANQFDLLTQLDMRFHEYFCIKANHGRLLKTWRTYEVQCQMLIYRRFQLFTNGTSKTVIEDHKCLLDAAYHQDIPLALEITRLVSDRVSQECIQMVKQWQSKGGELSIFQNQRGKLSLHKRTDL